MCAWTVSAVEISMNEEGEECAEVRWARRIVGTFLCLNHRTMISLNNNRKSNIEIFA